MTTTPERLARLSVFLLFLFFVIIVAGALYFFLHSLSLSVAISIILISAVMIIFFSQEIGYFTIFLFALLIITSVVITFNVQNGFVIASVLIGFFIIYSLTR